VHLRQAPAQTADVGRLLGDVTAVGDGVDFGDCLTQVLLAGVAEGDVCVVAHHHASMIGADGAGVIHRADELRVIPMNDPGPAPACRAVESQA
jgi:hypothetical protein